MPVTEIPPMSDPLGVYWKQPPRERIVIDETHALMCDEDFRALQDYTHSEPTGQYVGKMWKRRYWGGTEAQYVAILCFLAQADDPSMLVYCERYIVVVEGVYPCRFCDDLTDHESFDCPNKRIYS